MRIVVSGYYGFGNAGDEAVLAGLVSVLDRVAEVSDVTVLSAAPPDTERHHGIGAVSRWNPAAVASAIRTADGLISGGGGLLQDATSRRPVLYYAGVMEMARVLGRPYVVLAQGLGPLRGRLNRRLVRRALANAAHVSLRDDRSIALARSIGVARRIDRTADPALLVELPRTDTSSNLVVAVRGGDAASAYLPALREALVALAGERTIVSIPMHRGMDAVAAREVVAGVPGSRVVDAAVPWPEKLRAIGSAAVVVGVRLHSLVLAAGAGIPSVGISYDAKVDAFASRAGIAIAGPATAALDPRPIVAAVDRALASGGAPAGEVVAEMRREAETAVAAAVGAIGAAVRAAAVRKAAR